MVCNEFLERHSEFRDGLITSSREVRRFSRHLAHCAMCRRYDATIRQAVQALHTTTPISPSADFRERLDARLAVERRRVPRQPAPVGVSATMLVIATLALFFYEFAGRPRIARAPLLPPVAFPKPVAGAGLPFVSFQDPRASVVRGNPYPNGTVLYQPASASR
jgi:anti-sigma factor RsiW